MTDKTKPALRQQLKNWCMIHLAGMNAAHGAAMAQRTLDLIKALPQARVIACYLPLADEADPLPLINQLRIAGYTIGLPVVAARDEKLIFRLYDPKNALSRDKIGLPAPAADAPVVQPDVMVVPLLGFNDGNNRLGRGGGYYDRTLDGLAGVTTIGLAYDEQRVDFIPDDHDVALDYIVTQKTVRVLTNPFAEQAQNG